MRGVLLALAVVACTGPAQPDAGPVGRRYQVAGEVVDLSRGPAEVPLPGASGASARTRYRLLAEAAGDLDGDGIADRAAIVAVDPGGSGTFLHLAAVLRGAADAERPVESALLGDRIAVTGLRIEPDAFASAGAIIVETRERAPARPMGEAPELARTRVFRVQADRLLEIGPAPEPGP